MTKREAEARDRMQSIARVVKDRLPKGFGFIVFAFEFGPPGNEMFWVSNGQRAGCLEALREFIAKNEAGEM